MFKSFFMGGFEAATGYNAQNEWIDQIAATQHDLFMSEDYGLLREAGLLVAREAVRWPLVDRVGRYDFSTLLPIVHASREEGIELILDLFHYGYPDDLDPFSDLFVERFASYCRAVAKYFAKNHEGPVSFTPVNEPSYFAYAGAHAGLFRPHRVGQAFELKVNLAKASIEGINAIRDVIPGARIVQADPICRVCCPRDRCDLDEDVHFFNEVAVFESLDMIAGRLKPELGGSDRHLDIVGLNYYWTNQWEHTVPGVPLKPDDERCWPLRDLVRWVWHRYGHEMLITETSHFGENRAAHIRSLAEEVEAILDEGIPLRGVCLYPVLGMPEWHDRCTWVHMGLWDLTEREGVLERVAYAPALQALREAQQRIEPTPIPQRLFSWR